VSKLKQNLNHNLIKGLKVLVYKNRNPHKNISGDVKIRTVIHMGLVIRAKKAKTIPKRYITVLQLFLRKD